MQDTHVIVLAGGKGTRMKSELPKALVQLEGKALLEHQLASVRTITEKPTIVVGYKKEQIIEATQNKYHYTHQAEQLGTGHAVLCAREELQTASYKNIIVLPGDHPLVSPSTLQQLVDVKTQSQAPIVMASITVPHFNDPFTDLTAYGRVIRNNEDSVAAIIEYKDATDEQRNIKELNTGYFCFDANWLWENLDSLQNNNKSNEYYITDLVSMAVQQQETVQLVAVPNPYEGMGINTKEHLDKVAKYIREQQALATA